MNNYLFILMGFIKIYIKNIVDSGYLSVWSGDGLVILSLFVFLWRF